MSYYTYLFKAFLGVFFKTLLENIIFGSITITFTRTQESYISSWGFWLHTRQSLKP